MEVQEVMSTHVYTIQLEESTSGAGRKMREADVGCLVVVRSGSISGIITDRDLAIGCLGGGHDCQKCQVSSHMSSPVITVEPTMDMLEAAHIMTGQKVRRLPVVDSGELLGLVSLSDIALAMDIAMQSMDQAMHDLLRGMGAARSA